ncbi:LVIVD repeat-containing protein [Nocardiopsis coralliicola]
MSRPPTRRRGRWRAAAALAGAAGLALSLLGAAPAAADAAEPPSDAIISDNLEHVANVPKPEGLGETNSDLAFTGDYAIGGNYNGFAIYDISDPENPTVESTVLCPGGQGDVSVSGDLLYYSVDYPRESDECGAAESDASDADAFEGMRIFDISDKSQPEYVAAVDTDCGSHTNSLLQGDGTDYIYVSSYAPSEEFPNCQPPHDKISIIEVPLDDPASAEIAAEPVLFPDGGNEDQDGLLRPTEGCHDITMFAEQDIAAGACMGDGIIMDISDPVAPEVVETVRDDNFAFWHSATFTNNGKNVLFTDELGGGGAPTCTEEIGPERGANAIYSLKGGKGDPSLEFQSYYKIDRHQGDQTCVAHNGSLIPVNGKDYFVQSWYQGGVSIIDFNDPKNPEEIGFFDADSRVDPSIETDSDTWSTYYYNGYVYSNDIERGLDVLKIDDERLNGAEKNTYEEFNPQNQPRF